MKQIGWLVLSLLVGIFIGMLTAYKRMSETGVAKRDTITITREVRTSGREERLELSDYKMPQLVFVKAEPETIRVPRDTIMAREQMEYRDSTYEAWVSGIDARLDSIRTYARNVTIRDTITRYEERTITNTIMKKDRKWRIAITAGYGVTPEGLRPCIVLGVARTF